MNDLLMSRCKHCGRLVHNLNDAVVYPDGIAAHELCAYKSRRRVMKVNERALPALLGGIIESPFYGYEDDKK